MNHMPPRIYKPKSIPRVRTKPRRVKAIKCRPHINWVLENYGCALTGLICKSTGKPHKCWGPLDPHHTPTRGAGGGDNNIVPLCRGAHSLVDSPDWSEKRVEKEYGVEFRPMGDQLWQISPPARVYRLSHPSPEGDRHPLGTPQSLNDTADS